MRRPSYKLLRTLLVCLRPATVREVGISHRCCYSTAQRRVYRALARSWLFEDSSREPYLYTITDRGREVLAQYIGEEARV